MTRSLPPGMQGQRTLARQSAQLSPGTAEREPTSARWCRSAGQNVPVRAQQARKRRECSRLTAGPRRRPGPPVAQRGAGPDGFPCARDQARPPCPPSRSALRGQGSLRQGHRKEMKERNAGRGRGAEVVWEVTWPRARPRTRVCVWVQSCVWSYVCLCIRYMRVCTVCVYSYVCVCVWLHHAVESLGELKTEK